MFTRIRGRVITFLRWTERYTKTDMVYLASGGFWLSASQIISMAAGFALSLAFGNWVSKDVFGNYKFIFSLAGLFGTIALTASGNAVAQAVARGFDGALREGVRTYLRWSIPSVLVTLGASAYYFLNDNYVISISLLIVALCAPLLNAFNLYNSFLQGKKDFKRYSWYSFVTSVVPPLSLIALMLAGFREWVPGFVITYYLTTLVLSLYYHRKTVDAYKPSETVDPETAPYALHLSLINVLGRVASYIDKVLVFHFLGAVPLAVYSFASAPPQYVLRFNGIFRTLGLPKLAERDIPTLKRTLPRKIALHFLAALMITVVYIALAPWFYHTFLPNYDEAIIYSQALALTILSAPGVWLGQTLVAHMRKREIYITNTLNPLIKMGLYFALIPMYGIWGVVAATIAAGLVGVLISTIIFARL